jgi:FkbH-like protein
VARLKQLAFLLGVSLEVELSPYYDGLDLEMALQNDSEVTLIWLDSLNQTSSDEHQVRDMAQEIAISSSGVFFLVVEGLENSDKVMQKSSSTRLSTISLPILVAGSPASSAEDVIKYGHKFNSPRYRSFVAELVLKHLSSVVSEPIRMLAVDFDNTLYSGVLGEDGSSGLVFLDSHRELWGELLKLRTAGVLLIGITKNDPKDIELLFNQDSGFGLPRDAFTSIYAGWESKAKYLEMALESSNLDQSQCAFLDDNPAELYALNAALSKVYLIDSQDPRRALNVLRSGPRIPLGKDDLAELRSQDIVLRQKRLSAESETYSSVHQALQSRVVVGLASKDQLPRCQELLIKTNQFNISLQRTDLGRVDPNHPLITVWASVSDKFGDSGIVAVIVASSGQGGILIIEEFCISCRVLGRELESMIFAAGLEVLMIERPSLEVYMKWSVGARNNPGLEWASMFDKKRLPDGTDVMNIRDEWFQATVNSEDFQWVFRRTKE